MSDNFNILHGNRDNLGVVIVQALYVGLASVDGVHNSPELRIPGQPDRIINVESCFHKFRQARLVGLKFAESTSPTHSNSLRFLSRLRKTSATLGPTTESFLTPSNGQLRPLFHGVFTPVDVHSRFSSNDLRAPEAETGVRIAVLVSFGNERFENALPQNSVGRPPSSS